MIDFKQSYNRQTWLNFLEDSFLPDDFKIAEEAVPFAGTFSKNVTKLGACPSLQLTVFEVKHSSINDARVGLSKESFKLVRDHTKYNRALVLFVPQSDLSSDKFGEKYRFSYVEYTPKIDDKGKLTREITNPRRYSYILGKDAKVRTPQQYLQKKEIVKDAAELKKRFSVEVLTKEFYGNLFKWYENWAIDEVKFPIGSGADVKVQKGEQNRIHLIRFITRFIFVWFIKQKKLVPDWIFDEKEVGKVLKNFKSDSLKDGNYYNGIIQNLFFATLNKPIEERDFTNDKNPKEDYGIKTIYRDTAPSAKAKESMFIIDKKEFISRFETVPFLNGGLFECLDNFDTKEYTDGFSREENRRAFIPNALFWGKGEQTGLIELFDTYNFTIEENTPQDIDVALDPELLGKVFENLLGTFNEETKSTARNESGSFYTPREIVDYMVDTSLKEYLKGKLSTDDSVIEDKLTNLFSYQFEGHEFDQKQVKTLINAIDECKILDPACGSGAFPMGILNKLAFVMQKLDSDNKFWRQKQIENASKDSKEAFGLEDKEKRDLRIKQIQDAFDISTGEYSNYARKLFLIENCIYGVDIQSIAIQISKLRFFISLIVDQKTGGSKENNYNVLPLPNLETKFVAANTLIGVKRDAGVLADPEIEKKQNELLSVRQSHFTARGAKEKINLRKKDEQLSNELAKLLKQDGFYTSKDAEQLAKWNPYNQSVHSEVFDPYWMFGIQDGFDVVIGNPPYVSAIDLKKQYSGEVYNFLKANYETAKGTVDLYIYFFEKGLKLICENGDLTYISPNRYLSASYGLAFRELIIKKYMLKEIIDYSDKRVFPSASTYPVITLLKNNKNQDQYKIKSGKFDEIADKLVFKIIDSNKLSLIDGLTWGFLLNNKLPIVQKVIAKSCTLTDVGSINATSTAKEADVYSSLINEKTGYKLVNTGTIDSYANTWGVSYLIDKGKKYLKPYLPSNSLEISSNRHKLYSSPKIIIAKIGLTCESFYDEFGEYASINTNCIHSFTERFIPEYILCWLNSNLFNYIFECLFDGLRMSGGYLLYSAPNLKNTYIFEATEEKQKQFVPLVKNRLNYSIELQTMRNQFFKHLCDNFKVSKKTQVLERFDVMEYTQFINGLNKQRIELTLKQKNELEKYFNDNKCGCNILTKNILETDKAINNNVYELFDLTNEEISIVEDRK